MSLKLNGFALFSLINDNRQSESYIVRKISQTRNNSIRLIWRPPTHTVKQWQNRRFSVINYNASWPRCTMRVSKTIPNCSSCLNKVHLTRVMSKKAPNGGIHNIKSCPLNLYQLRHSYFYLFLRPVFRYNIVHLVNSTRLIVQSLTKNKTSSHAVINKSVNYSTKMEQFNFNSA